MTATVVPTPRTGSAVVSPLAEPPSPAVETAPSRSAETIPDIVPRPPSRPNRRSPWVLLAPLAATALAFAWAGDRWLSPRTAARMVATPSDLAIAITGPATLDATRESSVASRLTGVVATIAVDRNDVVTKGRVIATLDTEDIERQLESARAGARSARAAVAVARAEEARSEAALAVARATLDRQDALLARGVATAATQEAALSSHRQARADLDRSKATVDQAIAQAAAAEASVELQKVELDEATIRSSVDGIVVSRDRWVGDTVGPGNRIVEIVDPTSIVFTARFDESAIARVAPGQPATVRPTGGPPIAAEVVRLAREVDTETREFTVDLRPASLPPNWAIGRRAVATVTVETKRDVLSVPIAAIDRSAGAAAVWLDVGGRARRRPITLGEVGGDRIEVVKGLAAGDVVLTEPGTVWTGMRVAAEGGRR